MNRCIHRCVITSGALLGAIANADETDLFSLSIEELMQIKVEIASRDDSTRFNAPGSTSVFTRQQIEAMGVATLEELLQYVPLCANGV